MPGTGQLIKNLLNGQYESRVEWISKNVVHYSGLKNKGNLDICHNLDELDTVMLSEMSPHKKTNTV